MRLFSGQKVLLNDSGSPGPYARFSYDTSLSARSRLELSQLQFDFSAAAALQMSSVSDCLHSLDDAFCLVCPYRFTWDAGVCRQCPARTVFDHPLGACLSQDANDSAVVLGNIQKADLMLNNLDPFQLQSPRSYESYVYGFIDSQYQDKTVISMLASSISEWVEPRILIVDFDLHFDVNQSEQVQNPYFKLSTAIPNTAILVVPFEIDKIWFNSDFSRLLTLPASPTSPTTCTQRMPQPICFSSRTLWESILTRKETPITAS